LKVCFICFNFKKETIRRQPWRYVYEVSKGIIEKGMDVVVITDCDDTSIDKIDNIKIRHVKKISSIFGETDEVLKALAETFKNNLREQDVVGRWGGEAFIVVLPATDLKNAVMVAEKLRTAVEELEIGVNKIKVTISLGVSEYLLTEEVSELIKRADSALYLAKRSGKNCVKIET